MDAFACDATYMYSRQYFIKFFLKQRIQNQKNFFCFGRWRFVFGFSIN